MEKKKMMVLALFFMILAATVTAQTQVLQNSEFNGCVPGESNGYSGSPWEGGPSYSFSFFNSFFTNEPPGDDCYYRPSNSATQSNIVLDTNDLFDFEMLVGCRSGNGGSCTLSLSINDIDIPLTDNVLPQAFPTTLSSVTAKNIAISSSPATLKITASLTNGANYFPLAHATLTGYSDYDNDGILNFLDNCPNVFNPSQADFDQDRVGDACECSPDNTDPVIECRPSISVTLSVAPFSSTVLPTTPVSLASDNCGFPQLSLDKTVFNLRDTVAPVTVKATALDGSSNEDSCSTSVITRMTGSILTNPVSSLLSLPRGRQTTLTWTTNVTSFSASDTVTIKVVTLAGAPVATVVDRVRFTDGQALVTFSASLSNVSAFKLNLFLNNIPAGSHTIKFA
eukprot:TRINITY_DN2225_c0_g1_i4.p1 TRINITY_DN2225_c0_g1~~TRINITY_DN2225_c0_g1_i4.p1  ORF type:complete len:418 (+),score=151.95 TRINITY_DN2225_c0_g1_i4:67-1254(+)